jgi:DNA/RNA endonuclease YhcR with UshA esterase domain
MQKSKSLFIFIILISLFVFSCGSKDEKQEYVDDKPITNQNINSGNNTSSDQKKTEVKTDTLNPKTTGTDNSKDKDYKTYTKTYNPVAVVSPLEAGDYMGKEITVKGFVADVYKSEKVAYLNFVQKFPENPFTAVIFASRFASFGNIERYERKNVEVTGRVSKFKDKPQIILDSEAQIKIVQ